MGDRVTCLPESKTIFPKKLVLEVQCSAIRRPPNPSHHCSTKLLPPTGTPETGFSTNPSMVAAVLTLLWRDVAGVAELTRMLAREGFLWCTPTQVSQQAIAQRFLSFPAQLFERVFKQLLPELRRTWLPLKSPSTA